MASSKSQTILCHVCLKDFSDSIDLDPSDNCHRRNHSNLLRHLDESFVKTSMHKLLKSCILELKTRVISFDEILKFIFSSRTCGVSRSSTRTRRAYALDLFLATLLRPAVAHSSKISQDATRVFLILFFGFRSVLRTPLKSFYHQHYFSWPPFRSSNSTQTFS